jgi:hypothetical protein
MRSLSITTLMILAAFALGLAMGGELPRSVSAQDEPDELSWDYAGEKLLISNETNDRLFLMRGEYEPGATPQVPAWEAQGNVKVSTTGLDEIFVYALEPKLVCSPRECRRCNGELCPAPQWPPFEGKEIGSVVNPY